MNDKTVGEVFGFTEPLDMTGYPYPHDPQAIKHAIATRKRMSNYKVAEMRRLMSPRAQAWTNNVMWGLGISVEQVERHWLAISFSDGYKPGQLDTQQKLFNAIKELHDKAQRPL